MACQIKRDKNGKLTRVLAANGKESIAYNSLLEAVNNYPNIDELRTQYKDWVGKHIQGVDDPKELALALYKQLYSPNFKSFFGDWEANFSESSKVVDENGEPLVVYHGSEVPGIEKFDRSKINRNFERGEKGFYFSPQKNDLDFYGKERYPAFLNIRNPSVGTDEWQKVITNRKKYDGFMYTFNSGFTEIIAYDPSQIKSIFNRGQFSKDDNNIYQQTGTESTNPSKASPETLKKIKEFLDRLGVDVKTLQALYVNGNKIGANGLADPLNRLIQITQGKEDLALPEEAMHIAVEIIEQKNPALFKQMMNQIGRYNLFNEVVADYKGLKPYQNEDGKPNIPKLKKETIAKVLAQTIINKNEDANEKPEFLIQTKNWWQKIVDWLKGFFLKANMNPFETAAEKVLTGEVSDAEALSESTSGTFLQTTQGIIDKIEDNNKQVAKVADGYEVNGTKIRRTVEDRVKEVTRTWEKPVNAAVQAARDYKKQIETKTKEDLKDIFQRYIDDNGDRRVTETPHVNPSSLNPYNNEFYNTLEGHVQERLDTYPTGTKFFPSVNVYDGVSTAGTIDLLAILPSGNVDILQFKVPEIGFSTDINKKIQEAYNAEIEELRKILERGYGVKRADFRQTRVLPIKTEYEYTVPGDPQSGLKLKEMKVGNTNVQLIKDDTLLPVPSSSETTGNQKFDKLISRLKGLVAKLALERVTPDKRFEKNNRIAALLSSIRRLQIQGNATGILQTAGAIIKGQQEKYDRLRGVINILDPVASTTDQLNKVASEIMNEKDQIELYAGLYGAFKSVFTDGSDESKEYLKKAREISDDAQDALDNYWQMAVDFRTNKLAAKFGITDEFKPEKQLTWYRKMVRSLSQSSIKAGEILWGLVNVINNRFQLDFQDRLNTLIDIEDNVDKWLSGKSIKDLYNKIFAMTPDGKWKGSVIQRYARKFFDDLKVAQEKGDLRWVLNNIDRKAYDQWFFERHQQIIDETQNARYHPDDVQNKKIITDIRKDFIKTFSLNSKSGVNTNNYKLRNFPKEGLHESDEYKELLKPENAALLTLYNYWNQRLKESFESGMIDEHNGWSWFPNVRRNLLEKFSTAKAGNKLSNIFGGLKVEAEDTSFGKIDPLTNKPIDEVHANYVSDLGKWVDDANGGYWDYSEKSMDLFKVIALWDREIVKYKLKVESEDLAMLLHYTEAGQNEEFQKGAYKTKRSGSLDRDEKGNPIIISNEINARYIKEHIDAVWYSKALSDENDMHIDIPLKGIVTRINKFFGKEILSVPTEEVTSISGIKGLQAMNRFFVTKTLGLNFFTAAANMFGGTINSYINQGKFFNKKDILESEVEYTSARFYIGDNQKMAGLLGYLHPYLEDKTQEQIRDLSVSGMVRYLSSDHLFYLQRGSDNFVNRIIAMSFIKNTMLINGELVNIREFARKELGHINKYSGTYQDVQDFNKRLEDKVEELKKSPEALLNQVQIVNDEIVIPGVQRDSPTLIKFRQSMIEFIKDALGNTSREDLSLYKRSVMWQSFFMFKNWIPRMADVRLQSLKYSPGSQQYEWGRIRMLGNAVYNLAKEKNTSLLTLLSSNDKDIITVAKETFKKKQQYAAEQEEDFTMNEAEFVDMYIKGVRSEFKELALAIGLMALLVAARHAAPDKDQDPNLKGGYKWMLRGLDKLQDEVSFFYNPKSFTDIVNGSVFPSVGMLVDMQKFLTTGIAKLWYTVIGNEQMAQKEKVSKYLFKVLPITKELMTYIAIFNADFAKEMGIKISSQNGSSR